jgi:NAD(P)H-hydrate repair Nnr-like enzyme with NAD(P)H-hydrate epimerase domain
MARQRLGKEEQIGRRRQIVIFCGLGSNHGDEYIRVQDILIRGFCVDNFIFILIIFKT